MGADIINLDQKRLNRKSQGHSRALISVPRFTRAGSESVRIPNVKVMWSHMLLETLKGAWNIQCVDRVVVDAVPLTKCGIAEERDVTLLPLNVRISDGGLETWLKLRRCRAVDPRLLAATNKKYTTLCHDYPNLTHWQVNGVWYCLMFARDNVIVRPHCGAYNGPWWFAVEPCE